MIRLFCNNCPNDGTKGNGSFIYESLFNTIHCHNLSNEPGVAEIIGFTMRHDMIDEIMAAAKDGKIKCSRCGSSDIKCICELDLDVERRQAKIIENIGDPNLEKNNTLSIGIQRPENKSLKKIVLRQEI